MAIRIYNDKIRFVADSDGDTDIDLLIESDGLRFTGTLTTAYNVAYTNPPQDPPPSAVGTVAGFTSGGYSHPNTAQSRIEKFPFSISSGTATDVGDLSQNKEFTSGASSNTDGFVLGGGDYPFTTHPLSGIDKFPFSISSGNGTNVGDINPPGSVPLPAPAGGFVNGTGHYSETDAFAAGGYRPGQNYLTDIFKFPFAINNGVATDVGNVTNATPGAAGYSDIQNSNGFRSGGYNTTYNSPSPLSYATEIQKFPYSISSGTATDVGDTPFGIKSACGNQSNTDGFSVGGFDYPGGFFGSINTIQKFPFSISSGTTTDVGDLSNSGKANTKIPSQSTTDAFSIGGFGLVGPSYEISQIDKFPFSISSGTATDVGDITVGTRGAAGHQD